MAKRRPEAGKLNPAKQAEVLIRLQQGARRKGARNVKEVCALLDVSRSCFYAWLRGDNLLTHARSHQLLRAAGCATTKQPALAIPDHAAKAWQVFQCVRERFPTALLQCMHQDKEPAWVITAKGTVHVSLVAGLLSVQIGKQQVMVGEMCDAVLGELARVLALTASVQHKRSSSASTALTRLTRRFSKEHAR